MFRFATKPFRASVGCPHHAGVQGATPAITPGLMNLFACDLHPAAAARCLPSKLIVKMPVETCQMLAVNLGPLCLDWGGIRKKDGTFYRHRGFINHPCTVWGRANGSNMAWMIAHGLALANEYRIRYGKTHPTLDALVDAYCLFRVNTGTTLAAYKQVSGFARAMPDELRFDTTISDVEAYRRYLRTKTYAEWRRRPQAQPAWW